MPIYDGLVKSHGSLLLSFRTRSGIQLFQPLLNSGFRRSYEIETFYDFIIYGRFKASRWIGRQQNRP